MSNFATESSDAIVNGISSSTSNNKVNYFMTLANNGVKYGSQAINL